MISGRKTSGETTGDIIVNGQPKDPKTFPRITGYVEQQDIHDPHCTVREGLMFSAKLVRVRVCCARIHVWLIVHMLPAAANAKPSL